MVNIFICINRIIGKKSRKNEDSIKMALMTMIARLVDGLPLVGSMQDDEQVG